VAHPKSIRRSSASFELDLNTIKERDDIIDVGKMLYMKRRKKLC
jgi:hypothetical protein